MSKIRDFIIAIPLLCGSNDPERWGKFNELVFDYELSHDGSPFKRNQADAEDPENRMKPVFCFPGGDKEKILQCKRLVRLAELSHYRKEHRDSSVDAEFDALLSDAVYAEAENPEIAAVLTVDAAVSSGGWGG